MTEQSWMNWYQVQLERCAQAKPADIQAQAPAALRQDIRLAAALSSLDLSAESQIQASLRARLAGAPADQAQPRKVSMPRFTLASLRLALCALTLLVGLGLFHQPVLAAFGRWLGYGYLSQTGFIRLDQTLLLPGPLRVEGEPAFSISLGVAQPLSTRLWVSASAPQPRELLAGEQRIALQTRTVQPDGTQVWQFGPLPAGTDQTDLLLADGRRIALGWMPAGSAGLAPTAVQAPSQTPSGSQQPCAVNPSGQRLCVQAAQVDGQGLHLLVSLSGSDGQPLPGLDPRGWGPSLSGADLLNAQPGEQPGSYELLFQSLATQPATVSLHLDSLASVPGPFELSFRLPEQRPEFSPTPRVIETPGDQAQPAPTPQQ